MRGSKTRRRVLGAALVAIAALANIPWTDGTVGSTVRSWPPQTHGDTVALHELRSRDDLHALRRIAAQESLPSEQRRTMREAANPLVASYGVHVTSSDEKESPDTLSAFLVDPRPRVRQAAARALARSEAEEVTRALARAVYEDADLAVRMLALASLGEQVTPAARRILEGFLARDDLEPVAIAFARKALEQSRKRPASAPRAR